MAEYQFQFGSFEWVKDKRGKRDFSVRSPLALYGILVRMLTESYLFGYAAAGSLTIDVEFVAGNIDNYNVGTHGFVAAVQAQV